MALLDTLASRRLILSPTTRLPLELSNDRQFLSEHRGQRWAIKNGALNLYDDYVGDAVVEPVPRRFTADVARVLGFPSTPEMLDAVEAAIADTALTAGNTAYTAEIRELADRLGIAPPTDASPVSQQGELNRDPRIAFERTFIEPDLPAGLRIRRSVRIRNDGPTAIASTGDKPVLLSYHWLDSGANIVVWDGLRTSFAVAIAPGSALTVICDIETPAAPGRYRLQFQPLIEGVRWLRGDMLTVPITVHPAVAPVFKPAQTGKEYGYREDHAVALGLMTRHVGSHPSADRRLFLEIGGGISPQAAELVVYQGDIVAIDISFSMSQLGQLYFDHVDLTKKDRIAFVACDAHDPPFPAATFDGVAIFAALHHFAEPTRLLLNLRRILKPGGFIAVMCEPCVPDPKATLYVRDLEKGINEQCWTVEEHGEIFLAAGLRAVHSQVDGGSLKVILEA